MPRIPTRRGQPLAPTRRRPRHGKRHATPAPLTERILRGRHRTQLTARVFVSRIPALCCQKHAEFYPNQGSAMMLGESQPAPQPKPKPLPGGGVVITLNVVAILCLLLAVVTFLFPRGAFAEIEAGIALLCFISALSGATLIDVLRRR